MAQFAQDLHLGHLLQAVIIHEIIIHERGEIRQNGNEY